MEPEVLNTSDEAAKYVKNIEGWVDRNGRFFGKDEKMARWSGCTHIECPNCGEKMSKNYTACNECRNKQSIKRYSERESIEWDHKTPLYSYAADEYFFNADALYDYVDGNEYTINELRLVVCEPIMLRIIEDDYWCDELTDDGGLSEEMLTALKELNELINEQPPASWCPGKYAAIITP